MDRLTEYLWLISGKVKPISRSGTGYWITGRELISARIAVKARKSGYKKGLIKICFLTGVLRAFLAYLVCFPVPENRIIEKPSDVAYGAGE